MKKLISIMTMALMLTLSACGTNSTGQPTPNPEGKTDKGTQAEKISEKIITFTDSLGDPKILYLATVKNTDNRPLEFGNVTIDINDLDNNLIKHLDNGLVYPRYIMPGEYGYICEECAQLDGNIDLTKVFSADMHFGTQKANYKKPDVSFSQLQIKKTSYDWDIIGKVKSNEDIEDLSIAVPVIVNNELQAVAITSIENIKAGEEKGFSCTPIEYDPQADLSNANLEGIAYIW